LGGRAEAGRYALSEQGLAPLFSRRRRLRKSRIYEYLEAEGIKCAIRLPANRVLQERIGYLLKRPVGRPSNDVRQSYASFTYQAGSWSRPRRVIAKVEWHPGELYPRVGFIVTNMSRPAENVVATCEQWIKERKGAIKWTRLSCRSFAANAVRLQLHALAYNLGNFLRTLATPEPIKDWSLTTLKREAHQDRREGRQPRPLCRLPYGRGRNSENSVRRYHAADRGTAATTGGPFDVKRLIVLRPIENQGRGTS
jgi:Transposase DDE domain group 1